MFVYFHPYPVSQPPRISEDMQRIENRHRNEEMKARRGTWTCRREGKRMYTGEQVEAYTGSQVEDKEDARSNPCGQAIEKRTHKVNECELI